MDEATEREVIARTADTITRLLGLWPAGWHCKSSRSVNSRRLLQEHDGFLYDSDDYGDDLPYTLLGISGRPHVVLPYAFDTNALRFFDRASCEFSLVVDDEFKGRGLDSRLMLSIMDLARDKGLTEIEGLVLANNPNMLKLMKGLGFAVKPFPEDADFKLVTRQLQVV